VVGMVIRNAVLKVLRLVSEDPVLRDHVLRSAVENTAENLKRDRPCTISYTA